VDCIEVWVSIVPYTLIYPPIPAPTL